MDQERIQGQTATEEADKLSIMDILMVLRSRWLIILIITVLFAVGGYVYARSRKPVFTASVPVTFKTTVEQVEKDESGEYKSVQDGVSSTNYLYAYLDTAVEFAFPVTFSIARISITRNMKRKRRKTKPLRSTDSFQNLKEYTTDRKKRIKAV